MRPLKFLMTTTCYEPDSPVAGEMHIKRLAQELTRCGHQVHIIYSWDANRYKDYSLENNSPVKLRDEDGVFLHPVRSPLGTFSTYLSYITGSSAGAERRFKYIVEAVRPDVVHHHNIFFLGHRILRKQADYLCLYTAHDYWLICARNDLLRNGHILCRDKACLSCGLRSITSKRPPQLWRWSKGYRKSLADIDLILAPSRYMRDRLSRELDNRVEHLPVFALPPQQVADSGYSDYFLYAGVLARHKGIMNLLEVFRRYGSKIKSRLVIAGRGSLEHAVKGFIERHGLGDRVVLLGWVSSDRLWSLYKDALAVVLPSIWPENCPVVILEAMAMGTPSIGSDMGGLPEIIEKIDDRLIFESDDPEQLAEKLAGFDRSRYPADMLKDIYREHYSIDAYLEGYQRLIEQNY